jgi:hypothetical protein
MHEKKEFSVHALSFEEQMNVKGGVITDPVMCAVQCANGSEITCAPGPGNCYKKPDYPAGTGTVQCGAISFGCPQPA